MDERADSLLRQGETLLVGGDSEGAARCFEQARSIDPDSAVAHDALGRAWLALDRVDKAWECFHEAVALDPDMAEAHNNLGVAFRERGRYADAEACFRNALALAPASAATVVNLGDALKAQGRLADAIACFRRATESDAKFAGGWLNLGGALAEDGRFAESISCLERVLALDPGNLAVRWRLCFARLPVIYASPEQIGDARDAYARDLAGLDQALREIPAALTADEIRHVVGLFQPFYLAYQARDDRELQRRYGAMAARLMAAWAERSGVAIDPPRTRRPGRKLRIGIVSAQIRSHSVWYAITGGIVRHLSRSRFELYAYYTHATRDAETDQAQPQFDRFVERLPSLRAWAEAILHDAPDVLLYPEIGMDPMSVRLAALRLAPVQMAAWGHPGTSGLPTIDHFLSAEMLEPDGAQAHYTERLVKLAGLGCTPSPRPVSAARVSPRKLGIPRDGRVQFLSCQSLLKYLPQFDDVYPQIALRAGECRFIFVSGERANWTG